MNKNIKNRAAGLTIALIATGGLLATAAPAQAAPVDVACGNYGGVCWVEDTHGIGQYTLLFGNGNVFGNGGGAKKITSKFNAAKGNPSAVVYKSLDGKTYKVAPRIVFPQ